MPSETILIIEDEPAMLRGLKDNFEFEGFAVNTASDGQKGLAAALDNKADLIILDIMLPKVNGYEICRQVRAQGIETPIIMLTAKGQESDIIMGLKLGADDYVTKPFSIKELLARANAFLRRRRQTEPQVYRFSQYELDMSSRKLLRKGKEIILTPKEFALLSFLVQHAGRALMRDQILQNVWGRNVFVTWRSVDRCVTTLRKKIEKNPNRPLLIKTIREIGYRFEMPECT